MPRTIDIRSKGEMATFMVSVAKRGQVQDCVHLRLDRWPNTNHNVVCEKEWASRIAADNVDIDITGYRAPSSYTWPVCPKDCPHYTKSANFIMTVGRDQYDELEDKDYFNPPAKKAKPTSSPVRPETPEVLRIAKAVTYPDKVTLRWLIDNVPMKFWLWLIGIVVTLAVSSFVLGMQSTRLSIVKEWMGTDQKTVTTDTAKK